MGALLIQDQRTKQMEIDALRDTIAPQVVLTPSHVIREHTLMWNTTSLETTVCHAFQACTVDPMACRGQVVTVRKDTTALQVG